MITLKIEGYLPLKQANEMRTKYPSMRIASNEDFNGRTMYSYVEMVQFDDADEAILFALEASEARPVPTDKPFKAGHTSF